MAGDSREFRGIWFPANVWLDKRLTAIEKIILLEVDSLDGENGCYASNEYLADFCQCGASTVSRAISKLRELGYIEVKSFDGRTRILQSCLAKSARQTPQIGKADSSNRQERILDKSTSRDDKNILSEKPKSQAADERVKEVIDYLNAVTGSRYSTRNKQVCGYINARLRDGFSVGDFRQVIDVKSSQWLNTDMAKYLRPSTLFAPSHFVEYLNEVPSNPLGGYNLDAYELEEWAPSE